jgi:hypothetical protein
MRGRLQPARDDSIASASRHKNFPLNLMTIVIEVSGISRSDSVAEQCTRRA